MLKTLHGYLAKELGRSCILAVIAMTLVMTVLAILKPMRENGLAAGQVAELFVYTLPVILAFILPFAALFSTAIVYGRFTQDRELMAARASGISTIRLLYPAVIMGVLVTVITLSLANFIAPKMANQCQKSIYSNLTQIFFYKIKKERSFHFKKTGDGLIISADHVDEKNNQLNGVVIAKKKVVKPPAGSKLPATRHNQVFVAEGLKISTHEDADTGEHMLSFSATGLVGPISDLPGGIGRAGDAGLSNIKLPFFTKHKPSFYSWNKLTATLVDPTKHGDINDMIVKVKRSVKANNVLRGLERKINAGESYTGLKNTNRSFVISAKSAKLEGNRVNLIGDKNKPVKVVVTENGKVSTYTANAGTLACAQDRLTQKYRATLALESYGTEQKVEHITENGSVNYKESEQWGVDIPKSKGIDAVPLLDLYRNIENYTSDPKIVKQVKSFHGHREQKLRRKVVAEIHWRLSYGTSCMLLVAMGAAIGVMFKGDHMLSAFAVSVVPAAIGFILMYTGKSMISNPKSNEFVGIAIIWGSLGMLFLADLFIYAKLSRR